MTQDLEVYSLHFFRMRATLLGNTTLLDFITIILFDEKKYYKATNQTMELG
jgi:hypothetical protein